MSSDLPDELDLEEQADAVADFVEELLGVMDIDAIAEPAIEGDRFYVDILEGPPEDPGLRRRRGLSEAPSGSSGGARAPGGRARARDRTRAGARPDGRSRAQDR